MLLTVGRIKSSGKFYRDFAAPLLGTVISVVVMKSPLWRKLYSSQLLMMIRRLLKKYSGGRMLTSSASVGWRENTVLWSSVA